MKKLILYFLCAISLVSCGSMGKAGLGRHKAESPAQIYAEDINRTTMRAWASYSGLPQMNLEAYAAAAARAVLAEHTSALVSRTIKESEKGMIVAESELESVSKETIAGSRVVISDRYVNRGGSETCYLAVEISIDDIIMNIRHSQMIQDAISKASGGHVVDFDDDDFARIMSESFNSIKEENNFLDVSFLP